MSGCDRVRMLRALVTALPWASNLRQRQPVARACRRLGGRSIKEKIFVGIQSVLVGADDTDSPASVDFLGPGLISGH